MRGGGGGSLLYSKIYSLIFSKTKRKVAILGKKINIFNGQGGGF